MLKISNGFWVPVGAGAANVTVVMTWGPPAVGPPVAGGCGFGHPWVPAGERVVARGAGRADDPDRVEIPARTVDEPRWLVIGRVAGKTYSAVITYRDGRVGLISCVEPGMRKWRYMRAEQFDTRFDQGEDVTGELDLARARRPGRQQRRVNVDFPTWMIDALDAEASRLGVTRQSVIKVWVAERLDRAGRPAGGPGGAVGG